MRRRKGLSPVIASIILAAVVLAVGGGIWSYSYGAASSMATDYVETTMNMVNTIVERFNIEHTYYNDTTQILTVWVYNYGSISITVNVTAVVNEDSYISACNEIEAGSIMEIGLPIGVALSPNDEISITVRSERGNIEDEVYYVP